MRRALGALLAGVLATGGAHAADPPQLQVALREAGAFGEARIVLTDADGGGAVELSRGQPTPWEFGSVSWSPDGSRLAYGSRGLVGGDLYELPVDGGAAHRGSRLFVERNDRVYALNDDGTCEQPWGPGAGVLGPPLWRPDASPAPQVACIDLRVRATARKRPRPAIALRVENDGNETAAAIELTWSTRPGTTAVRRRLPPLAAGGATSLVLALPHGQRLPATVTVHVTSAGTDSDPASNGARVFVAA